MKNIDKVYGALIGVAVGDALGATVEFMSAEAIKAKYGVLREIVGGGWLDLKAGEITDDTQMTIAVAEGIAEAPNDPVIAIGKRFIEWYKGCPKDVGTTCSVAIQNALLSGFWGDSARIAHEYLGGKSAGNGSLMRTVYPGLFYNDEYKVIRSAMAISDMTHYDFKAAVACGVYSGMIFRMVHDAYYRLDDLVSEFTDDLSAEYDMGKIVSGCDLNPSGYVVDSFKCALHALLTTNSFEDAIVKAVNMGGDADTIGAITGGLAGAWYGERAIPMRWKSYLDSEVYKKLFDLAEQAVKYEKG